MSPLKDEGHCIYFTPGILSQLVQLLRSGSPQLKGPAKVVDLATSMIRLVPATLNKSLCVACKLIEGAVNSSFYRELTRLYGWAVLERVKGMYISLTAFQELANNIRFFTMPFFRDHLYLHHGPTRVSRSTRITQSLIVGQQYLCLFHFDTKD